MSGRTLRYFTTILVASTLTTAALTQPCEFEFGEPENLGPMVNTSAAEIAFGLSADGLSMFLWSDRPGGEGNWDIWVTTRENLVVPWEAPANLGPPVNTSYSEWTPSISADGLTIYFGSNRPGNWGREDIWAATRISTQDPWQAPVNLGPPVNTSYSDGSPYISTDGLMLLFVSDRPGGSGRWDLWMMTRASNSDPWDPPSNLGSTVNSSSNDVGPSISPDGLTLFFSSTRPGGEGALDAWITTRPSVGEPWLTPANLGPPINSSFKDGALKAAGNSTFVFMSDRPGGYGEQDLWQVEVIQHCGCVRDPDWICDGDVDGDGSVNPVDVGLVMAAFGSIDEQDLCNYDVDCDGQINPVDAGIVQAMFGTCEPPRDVCP